MPIRKLNTVVVEEFKQYKRMKFQSPSESINVSKDREIAVQSIVCIQNYEEQIVRSHE